MTPKEWLEWIDGAEASGVLGLSPMRELLADWTADRERLLPLVRELREALRLMFAAIPDGWTVPLLYSNIVGQCKEVAVRADKALAEPQECICVNEATSRHCPVHGEPPRGREASRG